ncbi:MAG: hypothetical protein JO047_15355 [Alphaproteobacteria bacterium]|nr:hypothetical protein [Alphaproteobacteria bacterium]
MKAARDTLHAHAPKIPVVRDRNGQDLRAAAFRVQIDGVGWNPQIQADGTDVSVQFRRPHSLLVLVRPKLSTPVFAECARQQGRQFLDDLRG